MGGKTAQDTQYLKSRALTRVIDLILDIESFEQQYVILKGLFQLDLLKQHMVTIGIDQQLSNCTVYEHRCLENIKKLYTYAGKCDNQLDFKAIIEL